MNLWQAVPVYRRLNVCHCGVSAAGEKRAQLWHPQISSKLSAHRRTHTSLLASNPSLPFSTWHNIPCILIKLCPLLLSWTCCLLHGPLQAIKCAALWRAAGIFLMEWIQAVIKWAVKTNTIRDFPAVLKGHGPLWRDTFYWRVFFQFEKGLQIQITLEGMADVA